MKCRGREYLRIIYGPDYDAVTRISRVSRSRGLGAKRSLALREFALGIESLGRFVPQEKFYSAEFMNASSAFWPWRASLSILGYSLVVCSASEQTAAEPCLTQSSQVSRIGGSGGLSCAGQNLAEQLESLYGLSGRK